MNWRLILAACVMAVSAEPIIYFREQFEDGDEWQKRWVESKNKSDYGKWQLTAGKFFGDPEKDKGIQTTQDWKNYALSARFEPISNENQTLVIQFTVKHEQAIDCGGGYVKIYPADIDQEQIHSESVYCIMFGPDICGTIHEKVHVIFSYKEKYHLITKNITCKHDELTHLYTLVIRPNNTYTVKIDNEVVANGTLEDDWDFLLPRQIIDENATKPADWDDRVQIEDPDAQRPEDWDEREFIPDPESKEPHDWDSSMDGEWEPPMIPNPKYTVKSGTIFDNFLITNDEQLAETIGNETWGETREPELKMKTIQDEERDAKDEKKQRWKKLEQEFAKLDEMERQEKERKSKLRKTLRKQYGLDPSPEQAQLPQPPPPPRDEL